LLSSKRITSMPRSSTRRPVGSTPPNGPPVKVPSIRH
jgi:hypothetical protein